MGKIRVLVADDHDIVREGLRQLIGGQSDMEIVGDVADGAAVVEEVRTLKPDVVLLDIAMPNMNGLTLVGLIKEIHPETRIVIFSMHKKDAYVQQALVAGAQGYVVKTSSSTQVISAIRSVWRGDYYLSPSIQTDLIGDYLDRQRPTADPAMWGYNSLSERQQGIFRLMAEGRSTKEMADMLCLSPKTVEKHRSSVMQKLGLKNMIDIMKYAVKIGILDPDLWAE
jgi:two-component system response regulator NreC